MEDIDDVVREFLVESNENLDQLDRDLVTLEKDPTAREILASIFRTIHTIKGTTGFLGFSRLETVAHVGENLLSSLRDGHLRLNAEITSGLLAMVDAIRQMLVNIETTGKEGEGNYTALIETLTRLQGGSSKDVSRSAAPAPAAPPTPATIPPPSAAAAAPPSPPAAAAAPPPAPAVAVTPATPPVAAPPAPIVAPPSVTPAGSAHPAHSYDPGLPLGEMLVQTGRTEPAKVEDALKLQHDGDERRLGEILVEKGAAKPAAVQDALELQAEARAPALSDSNIRVDVSLLDKLMNLVGELVLARNQILQFNSTQQDASFLNTTQRLNLITTELQEGVMKTRMQPIGNIWSKFPRVVRDLSTSCGKCVSIDMEGKETELDKTIIESIKDPLTHIVRNSVDHGIETPEKRQAAGKPPEGRLFLRAFHEGGQVNIEISDDGAGINVERVKQKAVEKALLTPEQAARLSEREAMNLLFMPGFSTAEKITNVSGRGVGLDVVKTNIEKIGGTVDVQSRTNQGTTIKIKIPLTLAIIPALIVTCSGDRYAIPQVSLLELVRLEGEQARRGIEMVHGAPVHRLRGRLLPLIHLRRELNVDSLSGEPSPALTLASRHGELPDFALARAKHRQWLGRLQDHLAGKIALTAEQAGAYRDCPLGKWLYSAGLRDYGDIPLMSQLERKHAEFHGLARKIVALGSTGRHPQAEQELQRIPEASAEIADLLSSVEKMVLEIQNLNIVVLQADERQFGLVVDEINDTEEIVVKPLGKQLKGVPTFAGATIMGDGRVALILDVLGLAQRANVVSEVRDRTVAEKAGESDSQREDGESLLLLRGPDNGRMALPLSMVARLEEFDRSAVETSEGRQVVQYRGQILPLIHLSSTLQQGGRDASAVTDADAGGAKNRIQVVVYSGQGKSVGLVVDRILDITHESAKVQKRSGREGTLGSMVVQGRVTELLDVKNIIQAVDPNFFEEAVSA